MMNKLTGRCARHLGRQNPQSRLSRDRHLTLRKASGHGTFSRGWSYRLAAVLLVIIGSVRYMWRSGHPERECPQASHAHHPQNQVNKLRRVRGPVSDVESWTRSSMMATRPLPEGHKVCGLPFPHYQYFALIIHVIAWYCRSYMYCRAVEHSDRITR